MSCARIAMAVVIGVIAAGCGGARPPAPTGEPPEYEKPRQFDLPGSEPAAAPKPEAPAPGASDPAP